MELTERQRQILRFIADYKARHGSAPTLREIAQHLKIYIRGSSTTSTASSGPGISPARASGRGQSSCARSNGLP